MNYFRQIDDISLNNQKFKSAYFSVLLKTIIFNLIVGDDY
jgi:hypothetical protein